MKTKNAQPVKTRSELQIILNETELLLGSAQRAVKELEIKLLDERKACEERGNLIRNLQRDLTSRNEKIQSALNNLRSGKSTILGCRSGETSVLALRAILTVDSTERILVSI